MAPMADQAQKECRDSEEEVPKPKRACLRDETKESEVPLSEGKASGRSGVRKKVVLLLCYNGKGYMGMQK